MFKALGSIMESRGNASDDDQDRQEAAKQRLHAYYIKFVDEPVFVEYVKREWENKTGETCCKGIRFQISLLHAIYKSHLAHCICDSLFLLYKALV